MKKALSKIVTIAMLVTMFSTAVNLCTASAAPKYQQQKVTNHHKQPSKPVKPPKLPKTTKCVETTPTLPCDTTPTPAPTNETIFRTTFTHAPQVTRCDFTISVGSADASTNENITLPVYFDFTRDKYEIAVCNFDITYDPNLLEYISYEPGSIVPDPTNNFEINKAKDGTLKVLFFDEKSTNKYIELGGIFANLEFKVIGTPFTVTKVNILNATIGDQELKERSTETHTGMVTISAPIETPTPPIETPLIVSPTPILSSFEVTVGSEQALPNENISLPIYFDDIPEGGLGACDLNITYDPKQLEYISCETGSIITEPNTNFAVIKEADGIIKMMFIDYSVGSYSIKSCGIAAKLNFKVIGDSYEVTHLNLSSQLVGDANLNIITASLYPGAVIIEAPQKPIPAFGCKIGSTKAYNGDAITLPVNFENVSDKGIITSTMTINYDPKQLEYVNYSAGSIVKNPDINFEIGNPAPGTLKVSFLDYTMKDDLIKSNGVFANLNFKVLDTECKSTQVNIVDASFGDIDLNTVKAKTESGTVFFMGPRESDLVIKN